MMMVWLMKDEEFSNLLRSLELDDHYVDYERLYGLIDRLAKMNGYDHIAVELCGRTYLFTDPINLLNALSDSYAAVDTFAKGGVVVLDWNEMVEGYATDGALLIPVVVRKDSIESDIVRVLELVNGKMIESAFDRSFFVHTLGLEEHEFQRNVQEISKAVSKAYDTWMKNDPMCILIFEHGRVTLRLAARRIVKKVTVRFKYEALAEFDGFFCGTLKFDVRDPSRIPIWKVKRSSDLTNNQ